MPKKRAHGEGSIYKRKSDNRWTGKLQVGYNPNGTPKYKAVYGSSQKEVKDKLEELKGNVKNNTFVEPHKITFGKWLDTWLNVSIKASIKETTWLIYESLMRNHIIPELGGIRLLQLRSSNIQELYNKKMDSGRLDGRKGGLSAKTIKHIHQVITSALDQAVKEKLISANPAEAAKPPKLLKKEMKTLSVEQIMIFLQFIKDHVHYKRYYAAYLLELYTGMRRGELLGLRWKDIDLKNGTVKVVQQLVKVGSNHVIRELKTDSSQNRIIAIPQEAIGALKAHKKNKINEYELLGYGESEIKKMTSEGLVFTNELGNLLQPRNLLRNFKGALKASGLPHIRFHDMRYTFALLSLQQGVDIKTLQSDLGHESIETTLDRYGHVNEKMKRDVANKRSELLKELLNCQRP